MRVLDHDAQSCDDEAERWQEEPVGRRSRESSIETLDIQPERDQFEAAEDWIGALLPLSLAVDHAGPEQADADRQVRLLGHGDADEG